MTYAYIITDMQLNIYGINSAHSRNQRSGQPALTHTYVARKSSHRIKSRCTVILTTAKHMESPKIRLRDEYKYSLLWGLWVKEASQNKLGVIHFTAALVTLAVAGVGGKNQGRLAI